MTPAPGESLALSPSRHNIIGPVHGSEAWFIVNPLSQEADILTADEARQLANGTVAESAQWVAKGYWVEKAEEQRRFRQAYLEFTTARDADEIQIFFAPWYACNFACTYCYQAPYDVTTGHLDPNVVEAFFAYVTRTFAGRRKYLTLFGGEPLLPNDKARESIALLLEGAARHGLEVAVVTNGYGLESYLPILKEAAIREIQITLDGPGEVHDGRRPLKGGGGTFETIARGVDAALAAGLPVNMRVVVDKENLEALPALADLAIARGWTRHPGFKTQLGRNYELHHCHSGSKLYTRLELYQALYDLIKKHPRILEYHRPAFSVSRFLFDHGELPEPLFDSCPATKTEWGFDYTGHIYSCTATIGKPGESLGTFYPEVKLDDQAVLAWEDRDVLSIDACKTCNLQLACGGGCGAVAKNRTQSTMQSDCRPIDGMLSLGTSFYFAEAHDQ